MGLIVLADAQGNPATLVPCAIGLLILVFSGPLSRGLARANQGSYKARFSLLNRERAEEIEQWSEDGGPALLNRIVLVIGGLAFTAAGLGLFLGILPSD